MRARSYIQGMSGIPWVLLVVLVLSACGTQALPTALDEPRLEQAATPNAGRLVGWGSDQHGLVSGVPEGDDFIAVSASAFWAVAIRADGSLVSWGDDIASYGTVSRTPSTGSYVAVAAGPFHGVAIRADGSLVSWGNDWHGLISDTPEGNNFIAVAVGQHSSVALRENGTLVSWGINTWPLVMVSTTPTGSGFTAVASGGFYGVAARASGGLARWGSLVYPYRTVAFDNTPTTGNYVAVSTSGSHGLALGADGAITAWGENESGQVSNTPGGTGFVAVAAGHAHSVALRENGTLASWGENAAGVVSATPTDDGFLAIAATSRYTVAIQRATDNTPPVITPSVSGTLGNNGWYTSDVTVSWTVVDEESDITSQIGCDETIISADTAGLMLNCEATSAGGTASESVTIKRDATPPTLSPTISPNPVLLDGSATASVNAGDTTSGVAAVSCDPVNTSAVGTNQTVTCIATDNAGNSATAPASYSVTYDFVGFSSPVNNPDVMNVAKAGQTIPLKWRLLDASGNPITTLSGATVTVASLSCTAGLTSDEVEQYASGGSGLQNLGDGYYQFNWQTPKSYAGSCKTMHLNLGEGITRTALFRFNK